MLSLLPFSFCQTFVIANVLLFVHFCPRYVTPHTYRRQKKIQITWARDCHAVKVPYILMFFTTTTPYTFQHIHDKESAKQQTLNGEQNNILNKKTLRRRCVFSISSLTKIFLLFYVFVTLWFLLDCRDVMGICLYLYSLVLSFLTSILILTPKSIPTLHS